MSRKIVLGDNSQYVESADSVIQNNYATSSKLTLPENISETQWQDFLEFIESFVQSKESEALSESDYQKLKTEIINAKQEKRDTGWNRFRLLLSDSANATTLLMPILYYVANNSSQISQFINDIFK